MTPAQLDPPTFRRLVYDTLRESILSMRLTPGEHLVETEIADRLGVSKTPVREAFARLHGDRLVQLVPYRGAMVRWLSVAELREQRFLADALEIPSLPLIAQRVTARQLDELGAMVDSAGRLRPGRDDALLGELTAQVTANLLAATGFPRVPGLLRTVVGPVGIRYDRLLVYPFADSRGLMVSLLVERHAAICRRDARRAVAVLLDHRDEIQRLAISRVRRPAIAGFFLAD